MAVPRCLLVVKSVHHQNTAHVAETIAGVLEAVVIAPEQVAYTSLENYSLVGFGSGVYYGRMHEALLSWVRGLPATCVPAKPAFVFSTSGLPVLAKLWHAPLKKLLASRGFDIIGEFSCRGFDTWGPLWITGGLNRKHPDELDLERAREFAGRLKAACADCSSKSTR